MKYGNRVVEVTVNIRVPKCLFVHFTKCIKGSHNWEKFLCVPKAGDTLSSRHVSSCDVTREVGIWEATWHWIQCADSHFCHSAYVTWSHVELWSAHVPARLCRTHFVRREVMWPHVSRNVCDNRNMRGVLAREPTRAPREIMWHKQSDRSVNLRHRIRCQIASHIPSARVTSHELTWREDSVSPA
jgi:hypothetical protein